VNFIVITKGSGRIAEVSARFSLDAMPGKQMAIDADLSAGLIDERKPRAAARRWKTKAASSAPWTVPPSSCAATPSPPDHHLHQHRRRQSSSCRPARFVDERRRPSPTRC
jgi:hypothetical protein